MFVSEIILISEASTCHPDHLVSESLEFFGKSKFRIEIEATRKNNRTGTLTIYKSNNETDWTVDQTINIDETNFKMKIKYSSFNYDFLKVEYQSISGNGGYLTVKLVG
jgi:hypothetical protein